MRALVLILVAGALGACRTTGTPQSAGYNPYAPVDEVQQVDGVKYQDPGRVEKIRAAFNTFRM